MTPPQLPHYVVALLIQSTETEHGWSYWLPFHKMQWLVDVIFLWHHQAILQSVNGHCTLLASRQSP